MAVSIIKRAHKQESTRRIATIQSFGKMERRCVCFVENVWCEGNDDPGRLGLVSVNPGISSKTH